MNKAINWLLDLFFPPKCMLCDRIMDSSEELLCRSCMYGELPEYPTIAPKVSYFSDCAVVFKYEDSIKEAILQFKFHGMKNYSRQFANWMTVIIRDKLAGKYDMISWVPCSAFRRWKRGYDQAEVLARAVAEELHIPAVRTLRKVRHNRQQSRTTSAAQRRANVLDAYRSWRPEEFQKKRILLIDDVLTTGSTMSECGKTLRLAGSGDLVCAALAAVHSD